MATFRTLLASSALACGLAGCTLAPHYERPVSPIPPAFPTGDSYAPATGSAPAAIAYQDVVLDPRLRTLIAQGLDTNRDLRIAAANIVAARAQYHIQRSDLVPSLTATGAATTSGSGDGANEQSNRAYSVRLGVSAFELDFFGRVRSLSAAALDRYLATEAGARATRLTLIGDIADAWSSYAADATLLTIAQDTAANAQNSVRLTQARLDGKVAPRTDLSQAQGVLADAQVSIAEQQTAIAQDLNALQLLLGAPVDPTLLPKSIEETQSAFALIPAGVDSSVLLRRPDVIQAEYSLRAANANIGAARAALFPSISITGLAGVASNALTSLFESGSYTYSAGANLALPIFQGGAGIAGVAQSKAQRDAALASYERAVQSAFRDAADALARQGTLEAQMMAQRSALASAQDTDRLTEARYRAGVDNFLTSLVAQRSLFNSRRSMALVQLTNAVNRVALYRALGGDLAPAR
jgi:multidrug efflux system outer membrane protein